MTGTGFAMCTTKESHDSDADLDVDGDDTLEYGKAQYPSPTSLAHLGVRRIGCVVMEKSKRGLIFLNLTFVGTLKQISFPVPEKTKGRPKNARHSAAPS